MYPIIPLMVLVFYMPTFFVSGCDVSDGVGLRRPGGEEANCGVLV